MATRAGDILVACVACLFINRFAKYIGVCVEHILRMFQIVTDAIVAETLTMAYETLLLICIAYIAVLNCPAEIGMAVRDITDDYRSIYQQIIPSSDNGHRMAQVALNTDRVHLFPLRVNAHMLVIVAAKAAEIRSVALIIGIGPPIQIHLWKVGVAVHAFDLIDRRIQIGEVTFINSWVAETIEINQPIHSMIGLVLAGIGF
jgi:hypothetical protein